MGWSSRLGGWNSADRADANWADAGKPKSKTEEAAVLHPLILALRAPAILRWSSGHAAALLVMLIWTGLYGQSPPPQTPQPSASLQSAEALLDASHPEEAIAPLRQLAAMQPPVKGAAHALGLACYRAGKLLEARAAFEQAVQEDNTDIESVQMEGLTLYRLGQPAAAIPYLERVQQWMPHANGRTKHRME